MLSRLSTIRGQLQREDRWDDAFDVLFLELELSKTPVKYHELFEAEALTDTIHWELGLLDARRLILDFLASLPKQGESNEHRNITSVEEGYALLLLAESMAAASGQKSNQDSWEERLDEAEELFSTTDCELGIAEVGLVRLRYGDKNIPKLEDWDCIEKKFISLDFLPGLERCKLFQKPAAVDEAGSRAIHTSPSVYRELLPLTTRSGNRLKYLSYQLRSMSSWILAPSFVAICESIFHPRQGFQSDELCLEAARLLSHLYRVNGNHRESAANALLHLKYSQRREDAELVQPASINFLTSVADLFLHKDNAALTYELTNVAYVWEKCINGLANQAIAMCLSGEKISYAGLPIEIVLWLSKIASHAVSDDLLHSLSSPVLRTIRANIELSLDLLSTLPPRLRPLFLDKIGSALGSGIEYCGNPILALQCYGSSMRSASFGNQYALHSLQLQFGRRLSALVKTDRGCYGQLQDFTRVLLRDAEQYFWADFQHQSSYKKGLQSSLLLASSCLNEAQLLVANLDWDESVSMDVRTSEQRACRERIRHVLDEGLDSSAKAIDRR